MLNHDQKLLEETYSTLTEGHGIAAPVPAIAIMGGDSKSKEEYNEEVEMIVSNLRQLVDQASEVQQYIDSDCEEWVQEKIAVCASKINSVLNYLKYTEEESSCECGECYS